MKRRRNGCGTLISKGKGKPWLAKWKFDGKTYYRSTGETEKKKAAIKLAEFVRPFQDKTELEVLNNLKAKVESKSELISQSENCGVLIADLMDKFANDITSADIAESSMRGYRGYVTSFISFLGANHPDVVEMKQVTSEIAKEYLEDSKDSVCTNLYNFRLIFLRRLWKMFGKEGGCKNVWIDFPKRKVDKGSGRRELTVEEVAKLVDSVKDDEEMKILFALGIYTGLRKGDCSLLKWSNIDFVKRIVSVIPMKTKRHITSALQIPIHDALFSLLMKRKRKVEKNATEDGGFVIPSIASKYSSGTLDHELRRLFDKCGIDGITEDEKGRRKIVASFHSLRHTFVSMNINGGMNPLLVQRIVGHTSVDMTDHYFHQNRTALVNGISKMPDVLNVDAKNVKVIERVSVDLDRDVVELLLKLGSDVNNVIRNLAKGCETVDAEVVTAEVTAVEDKSEVKALGFKKVA